MSAATERAGNTVASLRGTDVFEAAAAQTGLPSAADLDEAAKEAEIAEVARKALEADPELAAEIAAEGADFENDQDDAGGDDSQVLETYVTRAEFDAWVVSLDARIAKYNAGAPHKF